VVGGTVPPANHYGPNCALCHEVAAPTGPPLPNGASAPPNHYGPGCESCHSRVNVTAPRLPSGAKAPPGHYGAFCQGCHATRSGSVPPLPNGARVPSRHDGTFCTGCHAVTYRTAPRLDSDEEDEDEDGHYGDYCAGCHASGLAFSLARSPVYVRRESTTRLTGVLRLAGGARPKRQVHVWARSYPSMTWRRVASLAYLTASRTYVGRRRILVSTQFQLRFPGDGTYGPAISNRAVVVVMPRGSAALRRLRAWIRAVNRTTGSGEDD